MLHKLKIYRHQIKRWFSNDTKLKNYDLIPGPKPLPIIGNLWRYFPIIGNYDINKLNINAFENYNNYGSLVREVIFGKHSILHCFDPKDFRIVLKSCGKYPKRRSHRALMKYRIDRPDSYNSGGLFPENGENWYNLRKKLQRYIMNSGKIKLYFEPCNKITDNLIKYIDENLDENLEIDDFHEVLFRWSLENTAALTLDIEFDVLKKNLTEELKLLIKSAHDTHAAVIETETSSDLWKIYPTKSYKKLVTAQDNMFKILKNYLDKKLNNNSEIKNVKFSEPSIFNLLINSEDLDRKDFVMTVIDLFLAGLDTTSFTSSFVVYFLSLDPVIQSKLRKEIESVLDSKNNLAEQHLRNMPYLKACVKETMRLQPVSIGTGRVIEKEIILQNYSIPKDTMIILHNQVACRLEKNFKNAQQFNPERWFKIKFTEKDLKTQCGAINENWFNHENNEKNYNSSKKESFENIDPYLVLPFGYGPRVCIGRAFSEMNIYVLIAKLLYNYEISYHYDEIGTFTKLVNVPDKAMRFRFKKINRN
nr:cytochrome p450 302A1a [Polyphagotarsonemus latus]